ncbi:MAG: hypothetical protein K2H76_07500 [Muribaculaceae bacterium]|nr:hypothetical protein [Muribaculaceae bacterium]MDE6027154.1 hypothetical protein [Muribaculaceae bacterium]
MEERLKNTFGKDPGWSVPEGYFESFCKEMGEKLPEYKLAPAEAPMSIWQRMKPYVYLAAMFGGIWLMMNIFHNVSQNADLNIENPPEHIAQLMAADPDFDLYAEPEYGAEEDFDALIGSYDNISDFEKDMGLEIKED